MARVHRRAADVRCTQCGVSKSGRGLIHVVMETGAPSRPYCLRCLNTQSAERLGIPYQHHDFEPMQISDGSGHKHTFEFQTRICGAGITVEAVEKCRGRRGYEFELMGDYQEDQLALLGRLIEKIRRALSLRHVERSEFGWQITHAGVVRARICFDPDSPLDYATPTVNIDGREFSWSEFGRMLLTYEGFQFKMEIRDGAEEP